VAVFAIVQMLIIDFFFSRHLYALFDGRVLFHGSRLLGLDVRELVGEEHQQGR